MPAQPCYESAAMRQPALVTTGDTNRFIERLPRAMDALPPYALVRGMVVVRSSGEPPLAFAGAPSLWWVANASPPLLHACIEQFAAQIARREAPEQPVVATADHRSPAGDG